jgi:transposase
MSKKEANGEYAKLLYTVHGMSLQDIAAKLKISYRALQNWKKEGCWDAERQRLKEAEGATHSSFYAELATELRLLRAETGEGKEVDIARYKRIEILTNSMGKVLDYENKAPKKTEKKRSPQEMADEIDKIIRGEG